MTTFPKKGVCLLARLRHAVADIWDVADQVARSKAVGAIEAEQEELAYVFALLVQGSFIGMPSPPVQICMDLLPLMEKDLILLLERVGCLHPRLSEIEIAVKMLCTRG